MKIDDIHWHDSLIRKVTEIRSKDKTSIQIEVKYPIDWENNIFELQTIQFSDVYNYQIHEGPYNGPPTILNANAIEEIDTHGISTIRLETTAGYRTIRYHTLSLSKALQVHEIQ